MRVLIAGGGTGGHLMPALALADALCAERSDVEPVLVGAERGVEAHLLPERIPRYEFRLVPVEPLYRRQWWRNVRWLKTAITLRRVCHQILDQYQPSIGIGTGGYAAGPILYFASRRGVPLALQEQNAYPGITTRLLASRAHQLHLGFAEARSRLRPGRATEVYGYGNPISPPPTDRPDRAAGKRALGIEPSTPVCLIVGGSQGARDVNGALSQALDEGRLAEVALLWSTGRGTFERFRRHHAPPHRQVRAFWAPIAEAYQAADLVVARAGAMTTAELCAWGLPAILIPLPTAAADHQTRNAEALAEAGAAVHLPQSQANAGTLVEQIDTLVADPGRLRQMAERARARGRPGAAAEIARTILRLAG